jgi:TRAP-type C4-dicarboxylate transport system substrate-binding protein
MKRFFFTFAAATAVLASLQSVQAQELSVSTWLPAQHHINSGILEPYAERVAAATEGRVTLKFLGKPLGSPADHFELARKGVADITWSNFTYEPKRFAVFTLFELPFLSESSTVNSMAAWSTYEKYFAGKLKSLDGVELLGMMQLDAGRINMREHAVINVEDLAGKKLRAGGPIQSALLEKAGGVTVTAPQSKSYELLSTGVVDGTFANTEALNGFKLFEVVKHQTVVKGGAYNGIFFIAMNKKRFDSLAENDRAAIREISGAALSRAAGEDWDHASEVGFNVAKEAGVEFSEPSQGLVDLIQEVRAEQEQVWMESALEAGIENPREVMDFFFSEVARLDAEMASE